MDSLQKETYKFSFKNSRWSNKKQKKAKLLNISPPSGTSSERLMYIHYTSSVQGVIQNCLQKLPYLLKMFMLLCSNVSTYLNMAEHNLTLKWEMITCTKYILFGNFFLHKSNFMLYDLMHQRTTDHWLFKPLIV